MDAILVTTQTQALAPFLGPMDVKMINKPLENGPVESNAHIVIAFDVLQSENKLKNLAESVKTDGFILTCENKNVIENYIEKTGLVLISKLPLEDNVFYLLRKVKFLLNKTIVLYYIFN